MNRLFNLALLSALTLPLSAQRHAPEIPQTDPVPEFAVDLTVDNSKRLAEMRSQGGEAFFGFMIAATQPSVLDIPGVGGLLQYEAIVATALCKDGRMVLDLGSGGWGFDVYLQGVAIAATGAAMTTIEVVSDPPSDQAK